MAKMSEEMKEMKGWLENQGYRLWLRVFGMNPETDLEPRVYAEQGMVWQWKIIQIRTDENVLKDKRWYS